MMEKSLVDLSLPGKTPPSKAGLCAMGSKSKSGQGVQ
jgi:hypothetical protein